MKFYMSDAEILRNYHQAESKMEKLEQIKILSELNGCSKQAMRKHLELLGESLPVDPRGKKKVDIPEIKGHEKDVELPPEVFNICMESIGALEKALKMVDKRMDGLLNERNEITNKLDALNKFLGREVEYK